MKKVLLLVVAMILSFAAVAETKITRQGKTFVVESSSSRKAEAPVNTGYTWQVGDKEYPIYISPNSGACFIIRTSKKTGKEYRQYLPKDVSELIAIEKGITYKNK